IVCIGGQYLGGRYTENLLLYVQRGVYVRREGGLRTPRRGLAYVDSKLQKIVPRVVVRRPVLDKSFCLSYPRKPNPTFFCDFFLLMFPADSTFSFEARSD